MINKDEMSLHFPALLGGSEEQALTLVPCSQSVEVGTAPSQGGLQTPLGSGDHREASGAPETSA